MIQENKNGNENLLSVTKVKENESSKKFVVKTWIREKNLKIF